VWLLVLGVGGTGMVRRDSEIRALVYSPVNNSALVSVEGS
jgi:hypothetical protein